MNDKEFQTFTKTRWQWNEETSQWEHVTETFGRVVTGEWWRDESGEWTGWHTDHFWSRDENGQFVEN